MSSPFVRAGQLLVVFATCLGVAGFAATAHGAEELPAAFYHDFRGQNLPAELALYHVLDDKQVQSEPQGLRVNIAKAPVQPYGGVGIKSRFGLDGDFEVTAAFEILHADTPLAGTGAGVSLQVEKTEAMAGLARLVQPGDSQVLRWEWYHNPRIDQDTAPCAETTGRLRLKRTGPTLYFLWAPGTQGDAFQEIHKCEFGDSAIDRVRLVAQTGQSPVNVDVRLLDLRILGHKSGETFPALDPTRGGIAVALLIALVATLSIALGIWFFLRTRRGEPNQAEGVSSPL